MVDLSLVEMPGEDPNPQPASAFYSKIQERHAEVRAKVFSCDEGSGHDTYSSFLLDEKEGEQLCGGPLPCRRSRHAEELEAFTGGRAALFRSRHDRGSQGRLLHHRAGGRR